MKKISLAVVSIFAVLSLTACGEKALEPYQDAPRSGVVDKSVADVISMPDGFNNVASKCDGHGHRLYVTFHGDQPYGSIAVIDDPKCPGGSK